MSPPASAVRAELVEARTAPLARLSALFLALTLAWPSPALALRKSQEDGTANELAAGLEEPLGEQIKQALLPKLGEEYKVVVKDAPDEITVHIARAGHGLHSLALTILVQVVHPALAPRNAALPPASAWFVSINHPIVRTVTSSGTLTRETEVVPTILELLQDVRDRFDSFSGLPESFESPPTPDWLLTVTKDWQFLSGSAAVLLAKVLSWRSDDVVRLLLTELEERRHTYVGAISMVELPGYLARRPDDALLGLRPDGRVMLVDRERLRAEPNSAQAIQQLQQRAVSNIEVLLIRPNAATSWQEPFAMFLQSAKGGDLRVIPLVDPREEMPSFEPWFTVVVGDRGTHQMLGAAATVVRDASPGGTVTMSCLAVRGSPSSHRAIARLLAETVFAVAKEAGAKEVVWQTSTDDREAASFGERSSWTGGTVGTHYTVTLRDDMLRRSLDEKDEPEIESVFGSGLEEISAARWRQLVEGRTGRGIVVVPAETLGPSTAELQRLLERLPKALAGSVLLWGDSAVTRQLRAHNPALKAYAGDLKDMASYLTWLLKTQQAARAGILSDDSEIAGALRIHLMRQLGFDHKIEIVHLSMGEFTRLFETLGVLAEVSWPVVKELLAEQAVGRGA